MSEKSTLSSYVLKSSLILPVSTPKPLVFLARPSSPSPWDPPVCPLARVGAARPWALGLYHPCMTASLAASACLPRLLAKASSPRTRVPGPQAGPLMRQVVDRGLTKGGIKIIGPGDITEDEQLVSMDESVIGTHDSIRIEAQMAVVFPSAPAPRLERAGPRTASRPATTRVAPAYCAPVYLVLSMMRERTIEMGIALCSRSVTNVLHRSFFQGGG